MKRIITTLAVAITAAVTTVAPAVAQSSSPAAMGSMPAPTATACLLAPASDTPYSSQINKQIHDYGAQKAIDVTVLSSEGDLQKQVDQLNDCIAKPVDAIVLIAVDALGICPALQAAVDAKIPVLAVNSGVDASCEALTVGFTGPDYTLQAQIMGKYTCDTLLPNGGNVALITGAPGYSATIQRTDGFKNTIAELCGDKVKVIDEQATDWSKQKALELTRDIITKHGDTLNMIYGEDDTLSSGAAEAIEQAGKTGKILLTGIGGNVDGFALMSKGAMAATIYQSPVIDGTLAVDTLLKVLAGETIPARTPIDSPVITPDNMSQFTPAY